MLLSLSAGIWLTKYPRAYRSQLAKNAERTASGGFVAPAPAPAAASVNQPASAATSTTLCMGHPSLHIGLDQSERRQPDKTTVRRERSIPVVRVRQDHLPDHFARTG